MMSSPLPPVILSVPDPPVIVNPSAWLVRLMVELLSVILWILTILLLSVKTCVPLETSRVFADPPSPSIVSELPSVEATILKMSFPSSPFRLSVPAPPMMV